MEKVLSKDEINALVAAVFDGSVVPEKELSNPNLYVEQFDLLDIEAHRALPNLDLMYDAFIRYNRGTISSRLGRAVQIRKEEARPCKFGEFMASLPSPPSPVCLAIAKMDPLKGGMLIVFDSTFVFTVVDNILGGSGIGSTAGLSRLFTPIEMRLMEKIVRDALIDFDKAWAPICPVNMSLLRMEVNPQLVNIVPLESQVATITMKVQIEEAVGNMIVVIPFMAIEPIRDKLKRGVQMDMTVDPLWSERLAKELLEASLEVSVEIGKTEISMSQLLALKAGDTLMLNTKSQDDLAVNVAGMRSFTGIAGASGGNRAVQIKQRLHEGRG